RFDELLPEDKTRFLDHPLQVVRMEEEAPNEVRDLFIRLQSGTPLNPQEKRDAWPGNFTLFVIKHAGKDGHPQSNPHQFFDLVKNVGAKAAGEEQDIYIDRRSNTRKFFAGLAMTYLVRHESQVDFVDLKASNIDAFEQFRAECANAAKAFKQGERTKHYSEFVQPLSGSGSDTAETIRRRHQFLLQEIINIVQPRPRDPQRMFGQIEREIMWYRQS